MPHIRTDKQPVTQITVVESEPEKQAEALSLVQLVEELGCFPGWF